MGKKGKKERNFVGNLQRIPTILDRIATPMPTDATDFAHLKNISFEVNSCFVDVALKQLANSTVKISIINLPCY